MVLLEMTVWLKIISAQETEGQSYIQTTMVWKYLKYTINITHPSDTCWSSDDLNIFIVCVQCLKSHPGHTMVTHTHKSVWRISEALRIIKLTQIKFWHENTEIYFYSKQNTYGHLVLKNWNRSPLTHCTNNQCSPLSTQKYNKRLAW